MAVKSCVFTNLCPKNAMALGSSLLIFYLSFHVASGWSDDRKNISMAVMLPNNYTLYPWASPRVSPAIYMAKEAIERERLLNGYTINIMSTTTEDSSGGCSQALAQINAVDMKLYQNPDVFVGPGCVYSAASVARFATHWKLPLITAWAPAYGFAQKDEYKTTVRTGPSTTKLGEFVSNLHSHFNWTTRAVVVYYDIKTDDRPYYFIIEGVYKTFQDENISVSSQPYEDQQKNDYKDMFNFIKTSGRIIYICGPLDSFQKIMYQFQAEGISTEDYAIFYVDVFAEILEGKANREANKPWQNIENQLGDPIELFKTVFVITYREPDNPEYKEFQRDLHVRAKEDFNVSLDSSLKDYIAGCFYDGVILYAKALNQTLADGGSKKNGMEITLKMQNQQFWGVTGLVSTDKNNDRDTDFSLWAMTDPKTGMYEKVAYYNGTNKQIIWSETEKIQWPKGSPPLDNPPCLFDMDDPSCKEGATHFHLSSTLDDIYK